MTKMTNVKAIEFVLTNCNVPADVAEKLTAMKASFEKKSSAERKPTPTQHLQILTNACASCVGKVANTIANNERN